MRENTSNDQQRTPYEHDDTPYTRLIGVIMTGCFRHTVNMSTIAARGGCSVVTTGNGGMN